MIENIKKFFTELKSSFSCSREIISEGELLNTKKRIDKHTENITINFSFFNTLNEEENVFAFIIDKNDKIIEVVFYNNKTYKNEIVELKEHEKNTVFFIKSKKIYTKEYKIIFFSKDYFNEKYNSNIKIIFNKKKNNSISLNKKIIYGNNEFFYLGELHFKNNIEYFFDNDLNNKLLTMDNIKDFMDDNK